MLVCCHGWSHLRLRLVRLRRRETWAGLILDIVTITIAAVYRAYDYGCSGGEMEVAANLIVDRGACGELAGQTPDLLCGSADPTQFRLGGRIVGHSDFGGGRRRGMSLSTPVQHKFLYWKTVASHVQASQVNTDGPRFLRGRG